MSNKNCKISAIAIGNGESRSNINLTQFDGIKIGCNAIHRNFFVDYLVAVDRRCVTEALQSNNCTNTTILTRPDWIGSFRDSRVKLVPTIPFSGTSRPDDPFQWGSGPYAVLLAALVSDTVKMIGFDLWGSNQKINNVYKGTINYNSTDSRAVDPSYWIYQISRIFQFYKDKYFIIYNVENWTVPASWKLANVEFKTLDKLLENM